MSTDNSYVITVGRAFGAGGRELGQLLARRLGIAYYDKELLIDAAGHAGMDASIFELNDERAPGLFSGLQPLSMGLSSYALYAGPGGASGERVYRAQSDFIRAMADRGPCVIVGRTADYILRDRPRVLNIFLHAPEDDCLRRIMARDPHLTIDKARNLRRRTNKLRAEFYNFYTDRTWGAADTYHLCFDTSAISTEDIADIVEAYLKKFTSQS